MSKLLATTIALAAVAGTVPALAVGPYDPADSSVSSSVNFAPLNRAQSANQSGPQTQPQLQVLQPQLASGHAQQANPADRTPRATVRY